MFEQRSRKSKRVWHSRGLEPGDSQLSHLQVLHFAGVHKTIFLKKGVVNRPQNVMLDVFSDEESESVVKKWERDDILFRTTFFRSFFCFLKIL